MTIKNKSKLEKVKELLNEARQISLDAISVDNEELHTELDI